MKCLRWIFIMILCAVNTINLQAQINPECEVLGITAPLGFTTQLIPAQILPGENFCVQFRTENFQSVIAYQHTFTFDPTELCFSSYFAENAVLNSPINANIQQVQAGILPFVWFNNLNAEGQSIPDNTLLFTICFDACGEPSDCYELGFNEVLEQFPSTEVNYQSGNLSCTGDQILIDGASSTCIPIECADLSIIDLAICNSDNNMGSINFNVCGGTAPYSYEVTTANNIIVKSGIITDPFGTFSGTLNNLPAMNFTITITDANNVIVSMPAIIDAIPSITYDPIITVNPVCAETANGTVSISNISNAFGELFDLSFSNGLNLQDVNEATFDRLSNGDYFLTITEGSGCETVEMVTLDTPPLELVIQTTPASCFGSGDGFLSVQVTGGTPFPDGSYLINSLQGQTSLETTTPFLDNAFNGITNLYRIRIEDANGCRLEENVMIPVLTEIELEILAIEDNACKNSCEGSLTLVVNSPDGNYTFLVRDEDSNFVGGLGVIGDTLFANNNLCAFDGN